MNDILGHAVTGTTGDTVYRQLQYKVKNKVMQLVQYPVDLSPIKMII
jgi:hypothetical protein